MDRAGDLRRRALLAGGVLGVSAWVLGVPYLASRGRAELAFADLPDLPPFRRLLGAGAATSGAAIFAGLGEAGATQKTDGQLLRSVRSDPCTALFGKRDGDAVPVAVFSDFACPICRIMDDRLADLEEAIPGRMRIVRHQLPILGMASEMASRAVLAAELQGRYRDMHDRLIRTPAITDDAYVTAIAGELGLDRDAFTADLRSDAITRRMEKSAALAEIFGFIGTPSFAVGRTVFMGSLPARNLGDLIEMETADPCRGA